MGIEPVSSPLDLVFLSCTFPSFAMALFLRELFKRYDRCERAFQLTIMEMVVNGVSTHKVSAIVEELCGSPTNMEKTNLTTQSNLMKIWLCTKISCFGKRKIPKYSSFRKIWRLYYYDMDKAIERAFALMATIDNQ